MNIILRLVIVTALVTFFLGVFGSGYVIDLTTLGTALAAVVGFARYFDQWIPVLLTLGYLGTMLTIELVLSAYKNATATVRYVGGND